MQEQDLFEAQRAASEKPKHWTVSEVTGKIRGVVEPAFQNIWVQGEVSNYRPATSGHAYFSLKDAQSNLAAAVFGWGNSKFRKTFDLKDGLQVLCRGKITLYPPRGSYQLTIDHIEPLGAGALQLAFEQLKEKLSIEGLFDQKRKRTLPTFPRKIAVVTSPTGAVIQDILNVLKRRAPWIEVLVVPAVVQGEGAPEQLVRGIEIINRNELADLIVIARGGGSIEDLWAFNDERLARAVVASKLPVLSAVGHETDFTICDFVADLRAPTPSAAAEILSGHWVDAVARIKDSRGRLQNGILRELGIRKQLLTQVTARVVSPRDRLREQAQKCDELMARLERAARNHMDRKRARFLQLAAKLDALSPLKVLERGYSIVLDALDESRVVKSAKNLLPGQELSLSFHDGKTKVRVL